MRQNTEVMTCYDKAFDQSLDIAVVDCEENIQQYFTIEDVLLP